MFFPKGKRKGDLIMSAPLLVPRCPSGAPRAEAAEEDGGMEQVCYGCGVFDTPWGFILVDGGSVAQCKVHELVEGSGLDHLDLQWAD